VNGLGNFSQKFILFILHTPVYKAIIYIMPNSNRTPEQPELPNPQELRDKFEAVESTKRYTFLKSSLENFFTESGTRHVFDRKVMTQLTEWDTSNPPSNGSPKMYFKRIEGSDQVLLVLDLADSESPKDSNVITGVITFNKDTLKPNFNSPDALFSLETKQKYNKKLRMSEISLPDEEVGKLILDPRKTIKERELLIKTRNIEANIDQEKAEKWGRVGSVEVAKNSLHALLNSGRITTKTYRNIFREVYGEPLGIYHRKRDERLQFERFDSWEKMADSVDFGEWHAEWSIKLKASAERIKNGRDVDSAEAVDSTDTLLKTPDLLQAIAEAAEATDLTNAFNELSNFFLKQLLKHGPGADEMRNPFERKFGKVVDKYKLGTESKATLLGTFNEMYLETKKGGGIKKRKRRGWRKRGNKS